MHGVLSSHSVSSLSPPWLAGCRALFCTSKGGELQVLTVDHKPTDEAEQSRVVQARAGQRAS